MDCSAVILARLSSARLPGKVLTAVHGKPLLGYLVERLARARKVSRIVIATSDEPQDDPVAAFAESIGIVCVRGSLTNPAKRLGAAVGLNTAQHKPQCFVRVSGDSPLYDPVLLDQMLGVYDPEQHDLVTNVFRRTFPKGQSVEIFTTDFFLSHLADLKDPSDIEHITPYFYRFAERFRIQNVECPDGDLSEVNFCVDTEADLRRFRSMILAMEKSGRAHYEFNRNELCRLYEQAGGVR